MGTYGLLKRVRGRKLVAAHRVEAAYDVELGNRGESYEGRKESEARDEVIVAGATLVSIAEARPSCA